MPREDLKETNYEVIIKLTNKDNKKKTQVKRVLLEDGLGNYCIEYQKGKFLKFEDLELIELN